MLGFRDEFRATVVRAVACLGALFLLSVATAHFFEPPAVRAAAHPAPRPDWIEVDRPYRAFAVAVPHWPDAAYAIRRHGTGGGRKDILTVMAPDGARLLLEVYRPGRELARFEDPATELRARLADAGTLHPPRPVEGLDGKFGHLAAFVFGTQQDGRPHGCLGFARAFADPRLQIAGWLCRPDGEADRRTLACAIEGLSLLAAAGDPALQDLFARADRRRAFCTARAARKAGAISR